MQHNFYQIATTAAITNSGTPKYMQVVGTAEYVGKPSIGEVGGPEHTAVIGASKIAINETTGAVTQPDISSEIVVANSAALSDETTGGSGGGGGGTVDIGGACAINGDCISGTCNSYHLVCTTGENDAPCNNDTECRSGYTC